MTGLVASLDAMLLRCMLVQFSSRVAWYGVRLRDFEKYIILGTFIHAIRLSESGKKRVKVCVSMLVCLRQKLAVSDGPLFMSVCCVCVNVCSV